MTLANQSKNKATSALGNPKAASTRIQSATAKKTTTQNNHDLRRGPQPAYINKKRSHLNRVLIEPPSPRNMAAICESRRNVRDTERAIKSNAAISTAGVITFGSEAAVLFEALTAEQQDAAFREVAEAVADRLSTSLHALVVHLDESTIHAHYQLAAFNRFGEPLSKATRPAVMSELQDITAEIMSRHCPGIERGNRYGDRVAAGADFADVIHKSVAELHRTLPADLAAKREALAVLSQAETDAAARVDEMRGRVEKLTEKAALSEKEAKRLATYEKRLSDRLDELKVAQAASEAAKVEADRLADLARTDHDDMRAKVERSRLAATRIMAQAEDRALQMVKGAKLAAEDIREEVVQGRAQIETDRAELTAEFMRKADELDVREVKISQRIVTLKRVTGIITQAVNYLGEKLGLGRAETMLDAVDQLEQELDALSSPKSSSDPFDESGPGF